MPQMRGGGSNKARKTAREKGKGKSRADTAEGSQDANFGDPWPREPGPIIEEGLVQPDIISKVQIKSTMRSQNYIAGDTWDHYHSLFYNGWCRIKKIQPSNLICHQTLQKMGISESVQLMLTMMGAGNLVYGSPKLYPDLVRQLYASAELTYADIAHPRATEATFSYFAFGVRYSISIPEFCTLYGFADDIDQCSFPTPSDYAEFPALWYLMANGPFNSRENRLTLIRNPVIRFVAKIVGHTIFAKSEAGSLTHDELVMLTYGLCPAAHPTYSEPLPSRPLNVNRGIIFAEKLVEKKFRGIGHRVEDQLEVQGSFLTRLFQHHGIDLSATECIDRISYYDEDFFRRVRYMSAGLVHTYYDRQGIERFLQLPNVELTRPITRANVEFLPPPELQCDKPRNSIRKRQRVLRGSTPVAEPVPPQYHAPSDYGSAPAQEEYVFPPFPPELDLMSLSADPTPEEDREFVRDTMKKMHAIQKRMWEYWAKVKISCLRPRTTERDDDPMPDSVAGRHQDDFDDGAGHHFADHEDHGAAGRQYDVDMGRDIVRDTEEVTTAAPSRYTCEPGDDSNSGSFDY